MSGWLWLLALPLVSVGQSSTLQHPSIAADEPCVIDYWMVSTRGSPQNGCLPGPESLAFSRVSDDGACENSSLAAFTASLDHASPVWFHVHGNLTTQEQAIVEGERALSALRDAVGPGRRMTFVLVSWPSEQVLPITTLDLGVKSRRSDATAYYLARSIAALPAEQPVCLEGHSLGARSVMGALQLLAGGRVRGRWLGCTQLTRSADATRAVLLASSADHDWLVPCERFDEALDAVGEMLILSNHVDPALAWYPLRKPFSPHALGKVGLLERDWRRLGARGAKVSQVEVSRIVGRTHDVAAYFSQPAITELLVPYVYFGNGEAPSVLEAPRLE